LKNQSNHYLVEEGPGRGSKDIKKEFNVNCLLFCSFLVFSLDFMDGKITVNLKELHSSRKRRNTLEKSWKRTK